MSPLVAVIGAVGGCGATTIAIALARALGPRSVLLDLDLAGGAIARRLGIDHDALDVGVASPEAPAAILARLARPWPHGIVVPAGIRPELACAVRPGAVGALCAAAAAIGAVAVADVGRGAGPPFEAVVRATHVVLVAPATLPGVEAARGALGTLDLLGVAAARTSLCLDAGPAAAGRARATAAVAGRLAGRPVAVAVPRDRGLAGDREPGRAAARALAALAGQVTGGAS